MAVRIYLDIDGVLNALNKKFPDTWETWDRKGVMGYPIAFSPDLISSINDIADREDVEIVWLTTWQHHAAAVFSPEIGVNGQDWRILYEEVPPTFSWWKLIQIQKDLEDNPSSKFIWIDDDIKHVSPAQKWISTLPETSKLVISPDSYYGLTPDDICAMIDFINQ